MILDDICALSQKRAAQLDPSIRKTAEEEAYIPKNLLNAVKKCQGEKMQSSSRSNTPLPRMRPLTQGRIRDSSPVPMKREGHVPFPS